MTDVPHTCHPPLLEEWDHDEDWTCDICGEDWFVGQVNLCHCCRRSDGPVWEKFGTGDGAFPTISVRRGGIRYGQAT